MLVQWQKDFEVGHPATDAEHREVVDLLNELDVGLTAGSPPAHIDRILAELTQVLAEHLHDRHESVERVQALRRAWRERAAAPARSDLRALAHWWLGHLCGQDCGAPCGPARPPSH